MEHDTDTNPYLRRVGPLELHVLGESLPQVIFLFVLRVVIVAAFVTLVFASWWRLLLKWVL